MGDRIWKSPKESMEQMIIVVSTGRSGTGYMSKLLSSANIPIGHEEIFKIRTHTLNKKNLLGDSSWLAAPFLHEYKKSTIIHIHRNPIDVLNSFLNIKMFEGEANGYYHFITKHLPRVSKYQTAVDKAIYYIIEWNNIIFKYKNLKGYISYRIEDDPIPLIKRLNGDISNLFNNTSYNTRTKTKTKNRKYNLTDDDIPNEWKNKWLNLKKQFGY